MHEQTVSSLRDLEDQIGAQFPKSNLCFRGQNSSDWELIPSAYRAFASLAKNPKFDPRVAAEIERDTYREFDIQAHFPRSSHILERLSIAQHHGVPTRLLDWTLSLAVAVHFAVFGYPQEDAAVWALNLSDYPFPAAIGRQIREGGFNLDKIDSYGRGVVASFAQPTSQIITTGPTTLPKTRSDPDGAFLVWKPQRLDDRMRKQEGFLAWYHSFRDDDVVWNYSEYIRTIEKRHSLDLLTKFVIPREKRADFKAEILDRGVDEHFIFADLDGLGRRLTREHYESMASYTTS